MNAAPEALSGAFDRLFTSLSQVRESLAPQLTLHEVGTITNVATGIVKVSGLPGAGFDELLEFPGGVSGIAFNLDEDEIGVVLPDGVTWIGVPRETTFWLLNTGTGVPPPICAAVKRWPLLSRNS